MTTLPGYVCAYIVAALACYDTPEQVAAAVKVQFGLALSRQRIEAWHPERRAGARLRKHWRAMFYDVRSKLLAELDDIPIACQAYRLRVLDRVAARAEEMGNYALALRIIEQAAREVGDGRMSDASPPPQISPKISSQISAQFRRSFETAGGSSRS